MRKDVGGSSPPAASTVGTVRILPGERGPVPSQKLHGVAGRAATYFACEPFNQERKP